MLSSILTACAGTRPEITDSTLVKTRQGTVSGLQDQDSKVFMYKGIPYAAAPVGDLRWKAAQEPESWAGVKAFTDFGPSAIQPPQAPFWVWTKEFIIDTSKSYSEDSLSLNIWTPSIQENKKLPVLVFIHGGGFTSGGSSCEVYDGKALAEKGIVYVSLNYRVGILGFLAHPELSKESALGISGNYGIMDQIAALKWIKQNIAAFGGNPDELTIMGQSAGSSCVNALLMSPEAKGLFNKAVTESNNLALSPLADLKTKETEGKKAFEGLSLTEMRALSTEDLLKIQYAAGPIVDGSIIPAQGPEVYKKGIASDVPVISGMVEGDTVLFSLLRAQNAEEYKAALNQTFGTLADRFAEQYPLKAENDLPLVLDALNKDALKVQQYFFARLRDLKGKSASYLYFFTHKMPGLDGASAFHTADVPYFLNYFSKERADLWTDADYQTGKIMSSYLLNFVKTGNPNGADLAKWQKADRDIHVQELGGNYETLSLSPEKETLWKEYYEGVLGL